MKHRSLIALALATVASIGGTRLSAVAIPWLVLTTTNSPVLTGAVAMAELLPYVAAQFLAGPYIDRLGARRVAVVCDVISVVLLMIIPVLFALGIFSVWILIPVVAVLGLLRGPSDTSKRALVPQVAAVSDVPLERVTGILGTSDRLAGTLGFAGAGVLIALVGPVAALFINAATFLVSGLLLFFGVLVPNPEKPTEDEPKRPHYFAELASGIKTVVASPVYLGFAAMMLVTNMLDSAYGSVMLAVWIREHGFDVSWLGIILATFQISAILGAVVASIYGQTLPRVPVVIGGFLCAGPIAFMAIALSPSIWVTLAILLCCGFSAGFLNPVVSAVLFERIDRKKTGRMVGTFSAMTVVLLPFGGLYAGTLIELTDITTTLLISAVIYGLAVLLPLLIPGFTEFAQRRTRTSTAS
ncbi:MFS transporter [Devosia sp. MC1541]|uniref:MFS transporter n=1 Tax=Devosia sp. MC1541 TaxID=2725264 RepID=UPI00145C81A1|nr:MFS transporter [Devosia sp. MC1541]